MTFEVICGGRFLTAEKSRNSQAKQVKFNLRCKRMISDEETIGIYSEWLLVIIEMAKNHKKIQKSIVKVSNGFLRLLYSIQINLINLGTGYQMGTHFYFYSTLFLSWN